MSDPNAKKMITAQADINWAIEIYPFDDPLPKAGSLGSLLPSSVISSPRALTGIKSVIEKLRKGIGQTDTGSMTVNYGLVSASLSGDKGNPASSGTLMIKGVLPPGVVIGSWVIISSISSGVNNKDTTPPTILTRFIGQIYDVKPDYSVRSDGLLQQTNAIFLREWSWGLNCPIEYNVNSLVADSIRSSALKNRSPINVVGAIDQSGADVTGDDLYSKLTEIMGTASDPLTLGQMVLTLIGGIEKSQYLESAGTVGVDKLRINPQFATSLPGVPAGIMARLGINVTDPRAPFSSGFLNNAFGVLGEGFNNNGEWNGVFDQNNKIETLISKMKDNYTKNVQPRRPKILGIMALAELSYSAWSMMNKYCDSAFHEYYTTMWYERGTDGAVVGKPVLVARDKPFMLSQFIDPKLDEFEELSAEIRVPEFTKLWSKYDDLPRTRIPASLITGLSFSNSANDSYNYLEIAVNSSGSGKDGFVTSAAASAILKKYPQMARFGGKSFKIPTSFIANAQEENRDPQYITKWHQNLVDAFSTWYAYDYRMAAGQLKLKDNNTPITIGFNVQFTVGSHELVAHVDSYRISVEVDSSGLEVTNTVIGISRIVEHDQKTGKLKFINPDDFGSLIKVLKGGTNFAGEDLLSFSSTV